MLTRPQASSSPTITNATNNCPSSSLYWRRLKGKANCILFLIWLIFVVWNFTTLYSVLWKDSNMIQKFQSLSNTMLMDNHILRFSSFSSNTTSTTFMLKRQSLWNSPIVFIECDLNSDSCNDFIPSSSSSSKSKNPNSSTMTYNYSWARPFITRETIARPTTVFATQGILNLFIQQQQEGHEVPTLPFMNSSIPMIDIMDTKSSSFDSNTFKMENISNNTTTWLGLFSFTSSYHSYLNMSLVHTMLMDQTERIIRKEIQVLAFVDLKNQSTTLLQQTSFANYLNQLCPGQVDTFKNLLYKKGETWDKIHCIDVPLAGFVLFHGDFLVMRHPLVFYSYIQWLNPIIQEVLNENKQIHDHDPLDLNSNNTSCLYTHSHLFASYYFNANMIPIMTSKEYQQKLDPDITMLNHNNYVQELNQKMILDLQSSLLVSDEPKPIVFVLGHNHETVDIAQNHYSSYTWSHTYFLPTTYFFETYFYSHILGNIMDTLNIINTTTTTWIGSISWKADTKINMTLFNYMITDTGKLHHHDVDVLTFIDNGNWSLWDQTEHVHPGLIDLMVYILQSIGERMDQIEKLKLHEPEFKTFFSTYFVTRPKHMKPYIKWLSKVINFVNTDRKAQNMIWKDSWYDDPSPTPQYVYGLSYYPMHAFLGERLVQYYFNTRNLTILNTGDYRKLKGL